MLNPLEHVGLRWEAFCACPTVPSPRLRRFTQIFVVAPETFSPTFVF
jgi:hypothetical protein